MTVQIDAVYENGVFRPTRKVPLDNLQQVRLTIEAEGADQVSFSLSDDAWSSFCEALDAPPPSIPRLRQLLSEAGVFDARSTPSR
jgi:predicted DNA-binding antitoxin AbrB/MazE fold protein